MMPFRIPPYVLLTMAALFWGGNLIVGRVMVDDASPLAMAFWRFFSALMVMLPFSFPDFWRYRHLVIKYFGYLMLLGVTGITGFQTMVYLALTETTAVNASLFLSLTPIFIAIIAFGMGDERPGFKNLFGISVSMIGVMVMISRGDLTVLKNVQFNHGDLWMMAAVPLWALYSVLLKRRPQELPAGVLLISTMMMGIIVLAPFYLWDVRSGGGVNWTLNSVMAFAYLSIFSSVLSYQFWNSGVREIGAVRAGPFMHLVPVFATVLAIILLNEKLYIFHYIGVPLIALGILLNARK